MSYEIGKLSDSHIKEVLALWNIDIDKVYPYTAMRPIGPGDVFGPPGKHMENATVQGAFKNGRLIAAMKWGRRAADAPIGDLGNLFPGDGVISWLFFDDEAGAEELLVRARPYLGKRIYAFPEFGDMAKFTIFGTGMLSLGRQRIIDFFERHGFSIPASEEWGPQERICFHLPVPERSNIPSLPPAFHVQFQQEGLSMELLLHTEDGSLIGRSSMGPAWVDGGEIPNAAVLHWLGVEGPYRGQGLGKTLLLMQIHHARQHGMTDMYLTTHAERPAWKLYQRVGFREVDRVRSYALEPYLTANSETR